MSKKYILSAIFCLFSLITVAQTNPGKGATGLKTEEPLTTTSDIDTVAVLILDKMTAVVGGIDQGCVEMEVIYDVNTQAFGYIKNSDRATMCIKGFERLVTDIKGDKGHQQFWYNGETFSYYSWDNNRYAQVNYKGNNIDVIDTISKTFGVEFPGIDVFYPNFTDDAIASCSRISYLGQTEVNEKKCFHIAAKTPEMTWQLWVSNDLYFLPVKFLIRYPDQEGSPEYQVNYNKYDLNTGLPDAMFDFNPPPKAQQIKFKKQ